jgi:hypothetical protein
MPSLPSQQPPSLPSATVQPSSVLPSSSMMTHVDVSKMNDDHHVLQQQARQRQLELAQQVFFFYDNLNVWLFFNHRARLHMDGWC